jgi:hypothetical protein
MIQNINLLESTFMKPGLSLASKSKDFVVMYVQIHLAECAIKIWEKFSEDLKVQATEARKRHHRLQIEQSEVRRQENVADYRRVEVINRGTTYQSVIPYLQATLSEKHLNR